VDLSFSDNTPDGYFLISACKDGNPMLRQGETGDWVGTFIGHKGAVWAAKLNKSCSRAATGSADFEAKIWCALSGDEMHSFQHNHIVRSVDFAPDGNKLLTGGQEKKVRLFDLENRNQEPLTLTGHEGTIKRCLFIDQNTIMTIGDDKTFRQWDLRTGAETAKVTLGEKSASDLSLHANNKVCTLTYANTVAFYDPFTMTKMKEFQTPTQINSAHLHPQLKYFVAGGHDFKIYKFDYETGAEVDSYKGHFGPVHIIRFSPDGELYASGSEDGTVRLWQNNVGTNYGLWRCIGNNE
jgi:serine-threonine kinase receptor-associated protein